MGNRPKPTALKRLQGNPGKRPLNQEEPQFNPAKPRCPRHLDTIARREWHRIVAELHAAGLVTVADRAALAAYCQLYSRWIRAESELARGPLTVTGVKGGTIANPLVSIANAALDGMRKYLVEFGMTPSSRSRLHVAPPEREKSLEQMLNDAVSALPPVEEKVDARAD